MKKILLSLFAVGFIVSGFIFLVKPVMADTLEEGCLANQNYSSTTGQKCGCSHNEIYSSATGLMCARDTQVTGYLTEQGPSIYMWGTHKISINMITTCQTSPCPSGSYLVSAGNSSSVLSDLQKYENTEVKIIGQRNWYDLEGGFWGIVATKVIPVNTSEEMIKVLSPNGGEIYKVGETMNINWSTKNAPVNSWISLEINGGGHLIQQKIPTSQNHFSWVIPTSFFGYNDYPIDLSLGNNYKIKIKLLTGINSYCVGLPSSQAPCLINPPTLISFDESDNYFSLVSSQLNTPVISGISGPQNLNVNQTGTWKVTATDLNSGNLSYSVNWGDNIYREAVSSLLSPEQIGQSATFTHTYGTSGIYNPIFRVTNQNGVSAQTSLSVNVGNFFERTLRIGNEGVDVQNLQTFLGLNVDGSFGPKTKARVIEWQREVGLNPDGIFGPASRMKVNMVR